MQQLLKLLLSILVVFNTSCGWHLRNKTAIPLQIKKMIFNSEDLNSPLSKTIRNKLLLNNIELVEQDYLNRNVPCFQLISSSMSQNTTYVFKNKLIIAEYHLVLLVSAAILIPGKYNHPINTKVYRSFFDNQQTALAKDNERQIIINEMYDQAAEQLILQLPNIQLLSYYNNNKHLSVPLLHNHNVR